MFINGGMLKINNNYYCYSYRKTIILILLRLRIRIINSNKKNIIIINNSALKV